MLNELVAYADKYLPDAEPGFTTRELRWSIEVTGDGRFLNILPLGEGNRGAESPRCADMHGMNAGGKAHFLVESAQTIALLLRPNEDQKKVTAARTRHDFYVAMLREAGRTCPTLELLVRLLESESCRTEILEALRSHNAKPADWVGWRIGGRDPRLATDVQDWWRAWRRADLEQGAATPGRSTAGRTTLGEAMVCFVSGEPVKPLPTHPKISGLSGVGGLSMGDVMVGFDKAAFRSYALTKSTNAAMGAESVQKYVDGLNDLIRNRSRKLANALVTHWYKDSVPVEDDPLAFLEGMDTEEVRDASALAAARRLLGAIRAGERPDLANNRYHALTLSGAAGRVMVRDWMVGQFEDLAGYITTWFTDLQIVARDGTGYARDPKFMAVCGGLVRDLSDLPAPTAATLWKAAVQGLPIPQFLLAQALARFRAELLDKDQPPFNHARMGLIKAYFVRRKLGGDSHMTATYNANHPSPAYHCGGLLALFANLQRAALGDVGAGVVQRFYSAASQTPGLVIGRLATNARNHLGKLDPKLAWWYEQRIAEIMSGLGDAAPRTLDLEGQGLFALGYYQKLAQLRAGKKSDVTDNQQED